MNYNRQNFIQAWEAFIAPTERISIEEAQGRKAASTIRQYPPGIPDIIPGMRYSQDVLDRIKFAHTSGVDIIGIDMTKDPFVDVVIENDPSPKGKEKNKFDVQTIDSRSVSEQSTNEIADYFRAGFCAAPYFHFAFHESDPLQSLPHTIDYDAYAVSVALSDITKRIDCQNTLREIAIQRAKDEIRPDLDAIRLPPGFHRWTDKKICREQIKDRLSDPGYVTLVKDRVTDELVGLLHTRVGSVERLFLTEEWSDPLLFSAYDAPKLRDNPNRFFEKIQYHFGLGPENSVITISAQIISPHVQGGEVFYQMMRSLALAISPEHSRLPLMCEIPTFGTAHTLNTAFTERIVFGVLKNTHPLIYCDPAAQGLFPLINQRNHWNYVMRKAVRDKRHYQTKFFIPLPTDNNNVIVKSNGKLGLAVFATAPIAKGSRIAVFTGEKYQSETALGLPEIMRDHAIQTGPEEFVFGYKGLAHCVCHSCEPNCGIRNLTEIFAIRDIAEEEQITWDYRCSENSNWVLDECLCGSERCTGFVGNFDSLSARFKKEYLSKGMVSSWLTST